MFPFLGEMHSRLPGSFLGERSAGPFVREGDTAAASSGEPWVTSSDKPVACALGEPAARDLLCSGPGHCRGLTVALAAQPHVKGCGSRDQCSPAGTRSKDWPGVPFFLLLGWSEALQESRAFLLDG